MGSHPIPTHWTSHFTPFQTTKHHFQIQPCPLIWNGDPPIHEVKQHSLNQIRCLEEASSLLYYFLAC